MKIFKKTEGEGEDVVLFHGWCQNHTVMEPIAKELSKRYRVTSIDLPGAGQSDWSSDIKSMHDIAEKLLPELPESAIYVAWSFGGIVAMAIAAKEPTRMKRFIGLSTTPRFITAQDWPGLPEPGFKIAFDDIDKYGVKKFLKNYYDMEFALIEPKPKNYDRLIKLLDFHLMRVEISKEGVNIIDAADLRQGFKSMKCPIDFIFGDSDSSLPNAMHEKIKALNPKANLHIIPNAQHMFFWTHPEAFNKILNHIL